MAIASSISSAAIRLEGAAEEGIRRDRANAADGGEAKACVERRRTAGRVGRGIGVAGRASEGGDVPNPATARHPIAQHVGQQRQAATDNLGCRTEV